MGNLGNRDGRADLIGSGNIASNVTSTAEDKHVTCKLLRWKLVITLVTNNQCNKTLQLDAVEQTDRQTQDSSGGCHDGNNE